jgi:hypothetical protein
MREQARAIIFEEILKPRRAMPEKAGQAFVNNILALDRKRLTIFVVIILILWWYEQRTKAEELNSDGGPGSGRYPKGSGEKAAGEANSAGRTTSAEEKQKKIDSIKIDFSRDNTLPGLNKEDLAELGLKKDKPVLLKKNIIEKNKAAHPNVKESEYAYIIGLSLYNSELRLPGHETKPRFNFIARVGENKSSVVLLEVAETAENYEIVNLHWLHERQRTQKEKMGEKYKKN